MSLWKKSKSRKLHSLVMASILSFSVTCSVFAESFWSSIGTGEYSWDRDWTLSLSNCGNDGVNSSAFGSYLQYDASSGQLTLVYIAEIAGENNYTNRYYTNLGDAKAFFGGMSEEDIKDLIDDAIHNVDGDQTVNGNQDVTGDSHIGGNETVDGNETVKGDSFVEGNGHFDGNVSIGNRDENGNATDSSDLDVTGNGNFGGDVNIGHDGVDENGDGTPDRPGNLDVAGDSHLTGDTQVGSRDDNGAVVDRSDLDVTGNANLGGDTFVGFDGADDNGDGTPDRPGNMYIAGDTVIGVPGVPGAESNLHVTGNTTIDHDLYVGGEGHFDGNLYAPDLIFNGGKSLTGEISRLDGRIDTAGANAAALAGLHPLDFDEDQKLNFAAAVGSYQGASAMALGMFYRPDDRTMFNLGGTFGNRENMATLGVSFALDGPNAVSRSSKKKMQEQIVQLTAANAVMAENNAKMQTELEELKAMVMELKAEKAA